MMMGDGVTPSNTDRGYILRRLIRRAAVKSGGKLTPESVALLVSAVAETYHNVYDNIEINLEKIIENINREINKFSDSLIKGMKEFSKISLGGHVSGVQASTLFTTFGFPIETIIELAKERGITVDERGFREEIKNTKNFPRGRGREI